MSEVVSVALEWAAATGAPNALVVVALLTSPSTWSRRAVGLIRQRLGATDDD